MRCMHIHYNTILMIASLDLVLSYSDAYLCEELSELRLSRGSGVHSSWLLKMRRVQKTQAEAISSCL